MPIKAVLPSYPVPIGGDKKMIIVDMKGLAAYTAAASETLNASQLGQGGFDSVEVLNTQLATVNAQLVPVALSASGTYFVTASLLAATSPDQAVKSVVLKWYTTATGVEVVGPADLSAEFVRLKIICV